MTFQRKKKTQINERHEELINISKSYHERHGERSVEPAFENAELLLQNRKRIINEQATDVIKKRSKTQLSSYKMQERQLASRIEEMRDELVRKTE